jgi:hypothetical protein
VGFPWKKPGKCEEEILEVGQKKGLTSILLIVIGLLCIGQLQDLEGTAAAASELVLK